NLYRRTEFSSCFSFVPRQGAHSITFPDQAACDLASRALRRADDQNLWVKIRRALKAHPCFHAGCNPYEGRSHECHGIQALRSVREWPRKSKTCAYRERFAILLMAPLRLASHLKALATVRSTCRRIGKLAAYRIEGKRFERNSSKPRRNVGGPVAG